MIDAQLRLSCMYFVYHAVATNFVVQLLHIVYPAVQGSSGIYIHLLDNHDIVVRWQFLHRHILADLFPRNDLLLEHSRGPPLEQVAPLFLLSLIWLDVIPHQRRLLRRDDAHINIRSGTEIVENTGLDGLRCDLDRILPRHLGPPLRFKDRHRRQRSAAHGHVG